MLKKILNVKCIVYSIVFTVLFSKDALNWSKVTLKTFVMLH